MFDIISGFMQQKAGGLPYWGWFAIVFGIAIVLIVVILATCLSKRGKNKTDGEGDATAEEPKEDNTKAAEVKEEEKAEKVSKEEPAKKEEKPAEEKPAAKSKPTSTKTTSSTTAKKGTSKTEEKPESGNDTKVYHISKRKDDGKWQVKAEGADKALRLFFTQADAIKYAKKVAGNQEGRIVVHKEGGGFRKLTY